MGFQGPNGIHIPASGPFYQKRIRHCAKPGIKKGFTKGPQSGMRMLNYYINRAGRNLSSTRRRELNRAKSLLSQGIRAYQTRKRQRSRIETKR